MIHVCFLSLYTIKADYLIYEHYCALLPQSDAALWCHNVHRLCPFKHVVSISSSVSGLVVGLLDFPPYFSEWVFYIITVSWLRFTTTFVQLLPVWYNLLLMQLQSKMWCDASGENTWYSTHKGLPRMHKRDLIPVCGGKLRARATLATFRHMPLLHCYQIIKFTPFF